VLPRRGLIDTPVLIEIRRGQPDAHQFAITMLTSAGIEVSELAAMVLLAQSRTAAELQDNLRFLGHSRVHRITAPVSDRACRVISSFPPPAPRTADDAIVAATALIHKLPLYTLDPGRFAGVPGLSVLPPY
jgi:predicted nucleic acid-binding protein